MKGAITLGVVLASVIVSQLFIFSFRHIPLTDQRTGQEPLYALVGGAALALSAPTVPLLVVYLAVLFTARKAGSKSERDERVTLLPAALFLLAFVIAFVITISGKPSLIANSVYGGKWIINIIGGLFVAFYGLKAFAESRLVKSLLLAPVLKGRGEGLLLWPSVLGLVTGLFLNR
jgi:cytochrome c biogenesis protein CcdA